ncbi:FA13C protein, partial [Polypterus senegalus]
MLERLFLPHPKALKVRLNDLVWFSNDWYPVIQGFGSCDPEMIRRDHALKMAPLGKEEALDGGWGWVIIVVSFIGQFLAYGSPHAVGVLYPEWLEAFGESKGKTAWVGSLVSGTGLIASPICNVFVSKFGARPVMILSGIMMGSGYILSSFAPNIQFLFFSYGVMVGLGCGLAYAATVTIICQYFDKRRGLALGIAATGLEQKGLFRISSSLNKLKLLREKYERGEDVDLSEEGDVEQAASVLKLFLRELPEAVIPASVHIAVGNAYKDNKDDPALNHQIKMVLLSLPQEHYNLLKFIGAFLIKVASHSEVNQMTMENLATVFGPCIFQHNKNKENIPCSISSDDESQLKLNDFVPYTGIKHTENEIKILDDDSTGKIPELHSGLTVLPEHSYSQSSFLKLQALEVDLCSTFLPSQEDSAQGQNHKEPSLPPGRGGREAEGSPAEALPSVRVLQHESDSTAEENQSPRTSQLLHHITDGDNPLPSPRCPSLTQSQRFNMDPELAPSPPCSQQFIMARGLVSASSSEDTKESTTVAMLTKHIQNLKKKIRKYEEQFEQERNYRPSHNDKTAHPEIMKLMNDLAKSRKQLKDLKLKLSVEEMHKHETEQRDMKSDLTGVNVEHQDAVESQQQKPSIEETVECLIKRLMEKRQALGLPENMKCTKQERNLMKPLYDRYRIIKQLLYASPAITTIEEEGSDEDSSQQSPGPPSRIISQISTEESLCSQEDDNEPAFVSPLDEMKAVRQPAVPISHLHEASMPELLEHLRETRADKKRLRKALREFEEQFLRQMGRNAQKEDRIPMAEEYYEYKHIKAKLRLLEVLVSKQDASKAI